MTAPESAVMATPASSITVTEVPLPGTQQIDEGGGEGSAEKGEQGQQPQAEQALQVRAQRGEQHDGQGRAECRATRHPMMPGSARGCPETVPASRRRRGRECPHGDAQQGAWQTDLLHDQ